MSITNAISVRATGGALVAVDHGSTPPIPVLIDKLPNDLALVAARVRELVADGRRLVIDVDGRGEALRRVLGPTPGVRWYRKAGRERRELTDALDATVALPGFRFPPELRHRDELRRALEGLRKNVDEDGSPEGELIVALSLGLLMRLGPARIW